jgi:hypothetical protein
MPNVMTVWFAIWADLGDTVRTILGELTPHTASADGVLRAMVGNWLHGVAYKTALKAQAMNRRRRAKEREARTPEVGSPFPIHFRGPVVFIDNLQKFLRLSDARRRRNCVPLSGAVGDELRAWRLKKAFPPDVHALS